MTSNSACPLTPEQLAQLGAIADALAATTKPEGCCPGYGFALYLIPPEVAVTTLIANSPRERVAQAVGGWMLANNFAVGIPTAPVPANKQN